MVGGAVGRWWAGQWVGGGQGSGYIVNENVIPKPTYVLCLLSTCEVCTNNGCQNPELHT